MNHKHSSMTPILDKNDLAFENMILYDFMRIIKYGDREILYIL